MIPGRMTIANIGPFRQATVDWSALKSPVCVLAPYGSGKTFLVESLFAAIYGEFGWYSGSIYESLMQGCDGGEGKIELAFKEKQNDYHIKRRITLHGKSKSHKAWLKDGALQRAGPKIGDVDRVIRRILGDAETALATWFLSQNRRGDLCGQPGEPNLQARRRNVFNDLIGAAFMDQIEDWIAKKSSKVSTLVEVLSNQLMDVEDLEGKIRDTQKELNEARTYLDELNSQLKKLESEIQQKRKSIEDDQTLLEANKEWLADYEKDAAVHNEKFGQLVSLKDEATRLEQAASKIDELRQKNQQLDALREQKENLTKQSSAYAEYLETAEAFRTAEAALERLKEESGEAALKAAVSEEIIELASQVESLREEYRQADNRQKKYQKAINQYEQRQAAITQELNSSRRRKASLEEKVASRPETPFGEECNPCQLMKEWVDIPLYILAIDKEIHDLEREMGEINELKGGLPEPDDPNELIEKGRLAAAAVQTVKSAENWRQRLEEISRQMDEHTETLKGDRPDPIENPASKLVSINRSIGEIAHVTDDLNTATVATERLTTVQAEIAELEPTVAEMKSNLDTEKAEQVKQNNERLSVGINQVKGELTLAETGIRHQNQKIQETNQIIGRDEQALNGYQQRKAETAQKRTELKSSERELDSLKTLRQCFGPRGVRQLLIDQAAPELEAIADDLFSRATDDRLRLRITTQEQLGDGTMAEAFKILVKDPRGEREAIRYSGGQLQLILILFRIAVALWVAKIRDIVPETLILDEAFDRLGDEGSQDLMRVIEHLSGRFQKIIVVTHDSFIAGRMASRVEVKSRFGESEVMING